MTRSSRLIRLHDSDSTCEPVAGVEWFVPLPPPGVQAQILLGWLVEEAGLTYIDLARIALDLHRCAGQH